jgi:hypothetical protein
MTGCRLTRTETHEGWMDGRMDGCVMGGREVAVGGADVVAGSARALFTS